jgi:hypothetical protein
MVPDAPGLGVAVDGDRVLQFSTDHWVAEGE